MAVLRPTWRGSPILCLVRIPTHVGHGSDVKPDSVPIHVGHRSDRIRTVFRRMPDGF
jgi:hypothetical protein